MKSPSIAHIMERPCNQTGKVRDMPMIIDLRNAILNRVKDKDENELTEVINGSIGGDDKALPGLGVLFEIIWEHIPENMQQELVKTLRSNLST
jgi:small acid-soluble spore protein I (minor)